MLGNNTIVIRIIHIVVYWPIRVKWKRWDPKTLCLLKANVEDRDENVFNRLTDNVFGKLVADKGYISQGLLERLFNDGINFSYCIRSNMKNKLMPVYDRILLRKRSVIETINDELKNVAQLVHSRHRSILKFRNECSICYCSLQLLREEASSEYRLCYRATFRAAYIILK